MLETTVVGRVSIILTALVLPAAVLAQTAQPAPLPAPEKLEQDRQWLWENPPTGKCRRLTGSAGFRL